MLFQKIAFFAYVFFSMVGLLQPIRAHTRSVRATKSTNSNLPTKFRSMHNCYGSGTKKGLTRVGLHDLRASGSQQFNEQELKTIKKLLQDYEVIVVDLREEKHGFINGSPTWFFQSVREVDSPTACACIKTRKTCAESEQSLTQRHGMHYVRIPITDHYLPKDHEIDQFVTLIENLKPHQWLHFHCWWGHGRTTTLLAMYDILINAGNVSCDDIIYRQWALGGVWVGNHAEKAPFLKKFYKYALARKQGIKQPWSSWCKTH